MNTKDIHTLAKRFKAEISNQYSHRTDVELAHLVVDCFAALLVKMTLMEEHADRAASSLQQLAELKEKEITQ